MLILRRKSGESIVIGDNIVVTTLDINEGSVRLAIDAPKAIPILRSELLQAADANRDSAVTEQSQSRDVMRLLGGKSGPGQGRFKAVRPGLANRRSSTKTASASEAAQAVQDANPEAAQIGQDANPEAAQAVQDANPEAAQAGQDANPEAAQTMQAAT